MHTTDPTPSIARRSAWVALVAAALVSCAERVVSSAGDGAAGTPPTTDAPPIFLQIEGMSRSELTAMLERAMTVASSPEGRTHAKLKGRLQREVATTAIDLGRIELALQFAERIEDWRRGEVLALAAQALARAGARTEAQACVARAADVASRTDGWMQEQIRTEIGIALALLGDAQSARRYAGQLPQERTGQVEAELAAFVSLQELDRQCDAFDRAIATGSFDVVRSGVDGYFAVWTRVPDDADRAARAERAIRAAARGLSLDLQLRTCLRIAEILDRADRPEARDAELAQASKLLRDYEFTPDVRGPIVRDLAKALVRHGRMSEARALLAGELETYGRTSNGIVDIDRADFLRPLAEALARADERERALMTWQLALDAGRLNPNARPRAEDLCLTCLSMIRSDVEPSPDMLRTCESIRDGLKAPW